MNVIPTISELRPVKRLEVSLDKDRLFATPVVPERTGNRRQEWIKFLPESEPPFIQSTNPDAEGKRRYYVHQLYPGLVLNCVVAYDRGNRLEEKRNELFAVVRQINPTTLVLDVYASKALALACAGPCEPAPANDARERQLVELLAAVEAKHADLASENRKLVATSKQLKAEWQALQRELESFDPIVTGVFDDEDDEVDIVEAPRAAEPSPAPTRASEQSRIPVRSTPAPGRNERCPCGSGTKYKNCHLGKQL